MPSVTVRMTKVRMCKNSIVYKAIDDGQQKDPAVLSLYLMNSGSKTLENPLHLKLTIEAAE